MLEETARKAREQLVKGLKRQGIDNTRVLQAMQTVPRHEFVSELSGERAYQDTALPIEHGQSISQPLIVAEMTQALDPQPSDTVLEIGTGSGYQTAILCELFKYVYSVERDPVLSRQADRRLRALGYVNYSLKVGDGTLGWPAHAPFSAILVTAASPEVPPPLLSQLSNEYGRLVLPLGSEHHQTLTRLTTHPDGITREALDSVTFVPLVGQYGWPARYEL